MRKSISLLFLCALAYAQDPTAALEGRVSDPSGAVIVSATVKATRLATGVTYSQLTTNEGLFRFPLLPAGSYELRVDAKNFVPYTRSPIELSINQSIRVSVPLQVAVNTDNITVEAQVSEVEMGTNALGNVVGGRELVDLPLKGRNFTQLGLLQPGVAPLTAGLAEAGGSLRSGQAYAVNGQRPESNEYLLDGTSNVNRVDGGFAIRTPVDAIQEFRILTETAPPEYGGTSGATTTVVTRSGSNDFHGNAYEFLRNDKVDARNFFATSTEPLKQNQFGATAGGPIRKNRDFFFGFYEGFRNRQGVTKTAIVPTSAEREGDFSGGPAPLINYLTGQPVPGSRLPAQAINPVTANLLNYYPLGNLSPSLYSATLMMTNDSDQGGLKYDHVFSERDQLSARYALSSGSNVNPLSTAGADVPGFPVGEDLFTQSVNLSETHIFSAATVNSLRAAFFRNSFLFDKRLNHTAPRELGFGYDTTLAAAQGPPFFIVSGYASIGDPITGPRDTKQNTWEIYDGLARAAGRHNMKFGGEFHRNQINGIQGIASNGFYVFAGFPTSNPFANFLLGFPVQFFQAGGQLDRGLRSWELAGYAQDEWRVTRKLTLNYGLRYEVNTPFGEVHNELNAWAPGQQSQVFPNAPVGLLFPGDPGIGSRIAPIYWKGFMPRIGLAWDPTGSGKLSIRAAYGIFYDSITNGTGGPLQDPVSAIPWTQARQLGPGLNFTNPWIGQPNPFATLSFPQPSTLLTIDQGMRPPYAQNWNFTVQRSLPHSYLLDVRYVGNKGTRLPRMIEANPSVFGPGATAENADQRRLYAGCHGPNGPCDFGSAGMVTDSTSSTYHSAQVALSRRFDHGLGFLVSYWYSKSLDYVSSFNVSGSAPRLVGGENDLAQNPFDLQAEHGPSLFDARHRFVASGTYELPKFRSSARALRATLGGWQLNTIATFSTGTPFTVYDSANVSLQGSAPEISGFYSSRPDMVADPNAGPHTADQWVSPSAFRRLDPATQAGQFGNEGRNAVRGPGIANVDVSLLKTAALAESVRLQFRAECFNVANHANLMLPENDIASPNFGRILEAGSPRLLQFGVKLIY